MKANYLEMEESRTSDGHSPTNSSEELLLSNYAETRTSLPPPALTSSSTGNNLSSNWNSTSNDDEGYHKDSSKIFLLLSSSSERENVLVDSILITVSEEKASILDHFFQGNPFADYSQIDEIQQRTQLEEPIIRVRSPLSLSLLSVRHSSLCS